MLSKSVKNGQHCLVPNLKEKAVIFFTIEYISCGLVVYGFNYVGVSSVYIHFVKSFNHKQMLNVVSRWSCCHGLPDEEPN